MWGNELCWEASRARRGSGQKVPSSAGPVARGDTSPSSGFPTGQRRPQDSTRTAREASSSKN